MKADFQFVPEGIAFRKWVNQPSTLQPFYKYHGRNVLFIRSENCERDIALFIDARPDEPMGIHISESALASGWK